MPFARFRPIKQFGRYANRFLKKEYEAKRQETLPPFAIPPELLAKGVEIKDPNRADFPVDRRPPKTPITHPAYAPAPTEEDDPLYQPSPAHIYDGSHLMSEGLDQVLALTKSLHVPWTLSPELPEIANAEALVTEAIFASHAWDSEAAKLPPKKDEKLFWLRFPATQGISFQRRHRLLFQQLLYIAQTHAGDGHPIGKLRMSETPELSALLNLPASPHPLCFRSQPLFCLFSDRPPRPFASTAEVAATASAPLVDIYPIKPLIDFPESRIFSPETLCQTPSSDLAELHTSFHWRSDAASPRWAWSPAENSADAALKAVTAALVSARRRFGPDHRGPLPQPVLGQAVQANAGTLDFALFQLNTLDWDPASPGPRNLLAMKAGQRLFDAGNHWEDFGGEVVGLDLDVFRTLLAVLSN